MRYKGVNLEAGDTAQGLGEFVVPAEDPSTHMAVGSRSNSSSRGSEVLFSPWTRHTWHTYMHTGRTFIHAKINLKNKKKRLSTGRKGEDMGGPLPEGPLRRQAPAQSQGTSGFTWAGLSGFLGPPPSRFSMPFLDLHDDRSRGALSSSSAEGPEMIITGEERTGKSEVSLPTQLPG